MTEILSDTLNFLDEKRSKILPEYVRNGKPVYTLRKYADLTDLDAEVLLMVVWKMWHRKCLQLVEVVTCYVHQELLTL